jgi:hypothetical protein
MHSHSSWFGKSVTMQDCFTGFANIRPSGTSNAHMFFTSAEGSPGKAKQLPVVLMPCEPSL